MNKGQPPAITSSRWGARTKRIVVIVSLIVLGFILLNLVSLMPLLIVAMLLSYLLWPLVSLIEKRFLAILPFPRRSLAVVLTFMVVIAIFTLAGIVIFPVLIEQLADVGEDLPRFLDAADEELENWLSEPLAINGNILTLGGDPIILMDYVQEINGDGGPTLATDQEFDIFATLSTFVGSISGLTGSAFGVLGDAVNAVINLSFLIVIMFYFMRDGDHFTQLMIEAVPESYRGDARRMLYELGLVWNAYFRGQIVLSFLVGLAVYMCALILGLPNAPIFGLLSGLLEFIPNFGPFIAMMPAAAIALFSESGTLPFLSGIPFALTVIVIWIAIQNIESFFLVPRVMGGSLNLHPVVVILAVIAGASVAGALGVILAAPFTATIRLAGQYLYGKLFDTTPFPSQKAYEIEERSGYFIRVYLALRQTHPLSWVHIPFTSVRSQEATSNKGKTNVQ